QAARNDDLDLRLRPGSRLRAALVLGGCGRRKHGEDCGGRKDAAHPPFVSSGRAGASRDGQEEPNVPLYQPELAGRPAKPARPPIGIASERLLGSGGWISSLGRSTTQRRGKLSSSRSSACLRSMNSRPPTEAAGGPRALPRISTMKTAGLRTT